MPVERLFGNHSIPEAISITRGSAAVASGGPRIVAGNAGHHRLMAFVLSPGQSGLRQSRMSGHEGEEILDVLRGEVRLHLAGRSERLQAGDCAQFDASIPHRVEPASDGASEVLLVTVKPQEK